MPVQERRVLGRNLVGAINLYGFQFIIQTNSWTLFAVFLAYYLYTQHTHTNTNLPTREAMLCVFTVQCLVLYYYLIL